MGRRKRRKQAKAAFIAEGGKPKKKRRLRKLVFFGSVAGALAAWRQRQLAENEKQFGGTP